MERSGLYTDGRGKNGGTLRIETERLVITEFTMDMAQAVHENSLDEDNRRFVPDEVFETVEEARDAIAFLMSQYGRFDGPLAYPVLRKAGGENIGYVQLVPIENGNWEIGYHIAKGHTGNGYATEAVKAFLPVMTEAAGAGEVYGICLKENAASKHVLVKCGFDPVYEGVGEYQGSKREVFRSVWKRV
jgi:RimJ/RimL family protein N-acetyltransferase